MAVMAGCLLVVLVPMIAVAGVRFLQAFDAQGRGDE